MVYRVVSKTTGLNVRAGSTPALGTGLNSNLSWSANLAYAVGLVVTDGNLSKNSRHITLRSSDIECPSVKGQYSRKICYRLQFGNVRFFQWLLKIGLFPEKTFILGRIAVPDDFFCDFLRGHLDGDGSVVTYTDTYNVFKNPAYVYPRLVVRFISSSLGHMKWLRASIWRLIKESVILLSRIYYNDLVVCLSRKRKKAEQGLVAATSLIRKAYVRRASDI